MRKKAFTLIELLVVIAIIAVLVAILMPSLIRAKDLARRAMCGANLHSQHVALSMYGVDFNGAAFTFNMDPADYYIDQKAARALMPKYYGMIESTQMVAGNPVTKFWYDKRAEIWFCPTFSNYLPRVYYGWSSKDWWDNLGGATYYGIGYELHTNLANSVINPKDIVRRMDDLGADKVLMTDISSQSQWPLYTGPFDWSVAVSSFGTPHRDLNNFDKPSGMNVLYLRGDVKWKLPSQMQVHYSGWWWKEWW